MGLNQLACLNSNGAPPGDLLFEGDSMTSGGGAVDPLLTYSHLVLPLLRGSCRMTNIAASGKPIDGSPANLGMIFDLDVAATHLTEGARWGFGSTASSVYCVMGGAGDILNDETDGPETVSRLEELLDGAREDGWGLIVVSHIISVPAVEKAFVNNWIDSQLGGLIDAVVALGRDARLDDPDYPGIWVEEPGVHLNEFAHETILTPLWAVAINGVVWP